MKKREISFSGPMVRSILNGTKTMMRDVFEVTGYSITSYNEEILQFDDGTFHYLSTGGLSGPYPCPYGTEGDLLVLPGTVWRHQSCGQILSNSLPCLAGTITLKITEVRVERLQDITEMDAMSEGLYCDSCGWFVPGNAMTGAQTAVECFSQLWDSLYGNEFPWDSDPWVWCISFGIVNP